MEVSFSGYVLYWSLESHIPRGAVQMCVNTLNLPSKTNKNKEPQIYDGLETIGTFTIHGILIIFTISVTVLQLNSKVVEFIS